MFRMYALRLTHSSPTKAAKFRIRIYIIRPKFKKKSKFFSVVTYEFGTLCVTKMNVTTGW